MIAGGRVYTILAQSPIRLEFFTYNLPLPTLPTVHLTLSQVLFPTYEQFPVTALLQFQQLYSFQVGEPQPVQEQHLLWQRDADTLL